MEGRNGLLKDLYERNESIESLKSDLQKETEIRDMYRNTLSQLQRRRLFLNDKETEEDVLRGNNALIAKEISALREQIEDKARDLEILRQESTSSQKERHKLSSETFKESIGALRKDIKAGELELCDLQGAREDVVASISKEKRKYRELNGGLSHLIGDGSVYIHSEKKQSLDFLLLMEDSLRYSEHITRLRTLLHHPKNKTSSRKALSLPLDQIHPHITAMHRYGPKGEKGFLQKILLSLLEAGEMKEASLGRERRLYKTLGQRWIVLSKFFEDEDAPGGTNFFLMVECLAQDLPRREKGLLEAQVRQPGSLAFRTSKPKIL